MPSPVQQPDVRARPGALLRAAWLALLCVLSLHPLASAGQQGSSGLATLLRELLCGCASCAGESATNAQPAGCCEPSPEPAADEDCGGDTGCSCTHPDEVPLGESTPLARPDDTRRELESVATASGSAQPCAAELRQAPQRDSLDRALDACRPPPGRMHAATHERRRWTTRERLARLATCLI